MKRFLMALAFIVALSSIGYAKAPTCEQKGYSKKQEKAMLVCQKNKAKKIVAKKKAVKPKKIAKKVR